MPLKQQRWAKYSSGEKRIKMKRIAFRLNSGSRVSWISNINNSEMLSARYQAYEGQCGELLCSPLVSPRAGADFLQEKDSPLATGSKHWNA